MAESFRNARSEVQVFPKPAFEYDTALQVSYELDEETGEPKKDRRGKPIVALYGHLAFCKNCFRYRTYGIPCEVCGWISDMDWPLINELGRDFATLLLAVQHLFDPSVPDGGQPTVKAALRPGYYLNHTLPQVRQMMEQLKGIAASVGRAPEHLMPAGAEERIIDMDGVPTRVLVRGRSMTVLGPVDATAPAPSVSEAPRAAEPALATARRRPAPDPEPVPVGG